MEEIHACELAVAEICKAANDALGGFFMATIASNPAWNHGISKLYCTHKIQS